MFGAVLETPFLILTVRILTSGLIFFLIAAGIVSESFQYVILKLLLILQIRRSHLIADSLRQLVEHECDFKKPLKVSIMSFFLPVFFGTMSRAVLLRLMFNLKVFCREGLKLTMDLMFCS